ncbi:DUF3986 family protein [Paenibacillus sp. LHD-117]|uniref:DUF3986 family protein n=1 Tax=Paenibacillus sp. LHD-117 TaxID=3071412 RepID=UPI0027E17869|nr:DUF3986 family protein [Paenibacillus sp. LHD-117]MDQ6419410.1 DUF3986 family protein [Paenibacillus sp. LHD-117]
MDKSYFELVNYNPDKHWHIEYFNGDQTIEAIAFQRKHIDIWDVFFNDWVDEGECHSIIHESDGYIDPVFGAYLFGEEENQVIKRFHDWVSKVLLPHRHK